MIQMAIAALWFCIGLIVLAGIVWLVIWVIESFVQPIPERIKQGIWVIVMLLALIAALTILVGGGGGSLKNFRLGGESGGATAAVPATATRHLSQLLS